MRTFEQYSELNREASAYVGDIFNLTGFRVPAASMTCSSDVHIGRHFIAHTINHPNKEVNHMLNFLEIA